MSVLESGSANLEIRIKVLPPGSPKPRRSRKIRIQECEMCHDDFRTTSRFSRFCTHCKLVNDNYKFAEWLHPGAVLENSNFIGN